MRAETPFASGRAFYRFWLNLSRPGFAAWPVAAVANHSQSAEVGSRHFAIPAERRLINELRAGIAGAVPKRAWLPLQGLSA
ncbi:MULTISPECIES: hypothetical protein [unclassified Mesorhizobium]|uniref:hypothetical protein n=1 Tax=unclassified Mesorhizobium TaxID=325217 RepID=UPI000FD58E77|nr:MULTISPECIES: hypothetical protein [unclassified Mesorhizobium]RUV92383.1 hypothetical protein EOA88_08875 [Mesorhizobium sp. M5C.F.Ca.IN.020.14.1.1]RUV11724.1 hypothetical protein EOA86_34590 [Mesorhizobium sp. M5C.F.Ca.IN.020.32.2.1]RWH46151.1 MAG: hypothetical protein EOQ80_17735 [Mesorhizobium sp.]RWH59011.1 MAG: hypothetical protein EOQ82_03940 [Mesorhizobium sp.]RWI66977.1 MAG: hypothetical protein EOR18_24605 [Mesorhizobium sp.]